MNKDNTKKKFYKIRLKNSQGKFAIVDEIGYERVKSITWRLNRKGYAHNKEKGLMHRFLLGLSKGDKRQIHHKKQKLDNRYIYLQIVTEEEHKEIHRKKNKKA